MIPERQRVIETNRPHQKECWTKLNAVRAKGADKALVVLAGGGGKTMISIFDSKKFIEEHGGRVLCLCHRNDILDQLKSEFKEVTEILGDEYSFGMYNGNEKTNTTLGKKGGEKVDYLFASFQTMAEEVLRSSFGEEEFAYIIVDEAHHSPAPTFYRTLKYFRPKFLLGMTATPERKDKANLNFIFGETAYEKRLPEAIVEGLLVEPKVRLLLDEVVRLGEIYWEEKRRKISAGELNKRIFAAIRDDAIVELIWKEIATHGVEDPRMVIFCKGVRHAENIAARIDGAVLFYSCTKHTKLSEKDARGNLQAFRDGKVNTIVVVDKMNEGIDVPDINVIVNLRQTGSPVIAEQQLARGLRLHPGKEFVLVLDFVKNVQRLIMYWKLDRAVKEVRRKVHPDDLRGRRGGGSGGYDVSGIDITTNHPDFQIEDLDFMDAMGELIAMTQPYTREEVIAIYQKMARILGKTPTMAEIPITYGAIKRLFGTHNAACVAAGLDPNDGYTDDELIEQLRRKYEELGRVPTFEDVRNDPSMAGTTTFVEHFGSWNEALIAAGLKVNHAMKSYGRDELIRQMLRKYEELGRVPTRKEVDADPDMAPSGAFIKEFGSWANMLIETGVKRNAKHHRKRGTTRDEAIECMKKKTEELGRTPTKREFDADKRMPSLATVTRLFGSYNNLVEATSLSINRSKYITKDDILDFAREFHRQHGRMPTIREMPYDAKSIYRHFKSMKEIAKKIGSVVVKPSGYTDEKLLDFIIQKEAELKRWPNHKEVKVDKNMPSISTYARHFGTLGKAIELAKARKAQLRK